MIHFKVTPHPRSIESKRILIFTGDLPYPPYGKVRMYDMVRVLGLKHRVTLFSLIKTKDQLQYVPHLNQFCEKVETFLYPNQRSFLHRKFYGFWYLLKEIVLLTPRMVSYASHPAIRRRFRELLNEGHFDIVQLEYFASYRLFSEIKKGELKVLDGTSLKFNEFNRTYRFKKGVFEKVYWYFQYYITRRHELRAFQKSDLTLLTTEADKKTVQGIKADLKQIMVVKNGFEIPNQAIGEAHSKSKQLFMTGSMSFYPNIDAVLYFVEEIFPLILKKHPTCTMHVIGQNPAEEIKKLHDGKRIIVTGTVGKINDYIQNCGVCVASLRIGSGIKGKIIEAMANGRPVVTTPVGAEGMDLVHGEQVLIADSAAEFARHVISLIEDPDLFNRIASNGRAFVEKNHTFETTYGRLADFYSIDMR